MDDRGVQCKRQTAYTLRRGDDRAETCRIGEAFPRGIDGRELVRGS